MPRDENVDHGYNGAIVWQTEHGDPVVLAVRGSLFPGKLADCGDDLADWGTEWPGLLSPDLYGIRVWEGNAFGADDDDPDLSGWVLRGEWRAPHAWELAQLVRAEEWARHSSSAALPHAGIDVAVERERQREKWGDDHDDEHADGALAAAAAVLVHPQAPPEPCGCREAMCPHVPVVIVEPIRAPDWAHPLRWRHADRRRQLVIGAALAIAEIERIDRQAERARRAALRNALKKEAGF